jgi:NTE family protein
VLYYQYNLGMQEPEPQHLIAKSSLFHHMRPYETEAILARLQPSHYARGSRILERGVWHGRLYIIASGQVSVLLQDEDGAEQKSVADQEVRGKRSANGPYIVARLGPGECFGEMSLITGEPPSATIRAEGDTTLWSLTQTDFLTLIGTCPTLLQNINGILSQRLARANQHLISRQSARTLLLTTIEAPGAAPEHALAFHIADALAERSRRRVLLLELCGHEQAASLRFALHAGQSRPDLLACRADRSLLQAHRAPTLDSAGHCIPALAALAETQERACAIDAGALFTLGELALLYDYLLLVANEKTPEHILEALATGREADLVTEAIALISADALERYSTAARSSPHDIFVTHVAELPTIGAQDRYAQQLGQSVRRLLPADAELLERCWQERASLRQLAPDAALSRAIDFVARHIARQTLGIAFGGGGARGFAHLGVLEGLLAYHIPLDYIAGCSSGIIAPGMYLIGKSPAESEEIFMEIQRHIVQWSFPRTAIFSSKGIRRMLYNLCGDLRFEDLTTPFAMVAADLTTRSGVVLDRGLLWQAGLASVALPGIFPPVLIGEHILVDAGMHDPVPIRLVHQMGAHILLASELGGQNPPSLTSATPWIEEAVAPKQQWQRRASPHIIDLLLRTYDLAMATIGMHSIREADVVIRPRLHRVSLRQFAEGRKFVAAGREAVEQALPALRERLPWL